MLLPWKYHRISWVVIFGNLRAVIAPVNTQSFLFFLFLDVIIAVKVKSVATRMAKQRGTLGEHNHYSPEKRDILIYVINNIDDVIAIKQGNLLTITDDHNVWFVRDDDNVRLVDQNTIAIRTVIRGQT